MIFKHGFVTTRVSYIRRCVNFVSILATVLSVACARVETPRVTAIPVHIRAGADSATLPLLRTLALTWQGKHPHWVFTFDTGGGDALQKKLRDGTLDLVAVSELGVDPGFQPWHTDLAVDGVALIVNTANPLTGLTSADLREIFAGYRNEWAYFGAQQPGSIQTVMREAGDSSRKTFDTLVMGDVPGTQSAVVMPSPETVMNFVALNPGAIGYVPSGQVTAAPQPALRMLLVDGQPPSAEALASGNYPLRRTLSLVARSEPQGDLRAFLVWALSDEGRQIAESLGYARLK